MNFKDEDYCTISEQQGTGFGPFGPYGIRVQIAGFPSLPEKEDFGPFYHETRIARPHLEEIIAELWRQHVLNDPEFPKRKEEQKNKILECFPDSPIYVEEIPNEYCKGACCYDRPWLIVTTNRGRIKIGWRKRVINIDWKDSTIKQSGHQLFPNDEVTRWETGIHAYSYEDATRYLKTALESQ